jgi:hypothetical protein
LRLIGTALTRQLSALLGEPLNAPLELTTELNLTQGYGRSIAGYLRQAIADFEESGSVLCNSVTANTFEQFIMTALLLSHPHNYSEALQRLDKPIAPRGVKRAIEYIDSHLESASAILWPRREFPDEPFFGTSRIIEAHRRSAICEWHDSRGFDKGCSKQSRNRRSPR